MMNKTFMLILSFTLIVSFSLYLDRAAYANTLEQGEIINGVNFRTNPSVTANTIRLLRKGEVVQIVKKTNAFWYHVKDGNGRVGFVSANPKYIRLVPGGAAAAKQPVGTVQYNNGQAVIAAGMKNIGTQYEFGSNRNSTATFDCSDFVRRAYIDGIGLRLPADSRSQGAYVKEKGNIKSDWRHLQPGDIMFFMAYQGSKESDYSGIDKNNERITHNGIYIGDGKILHTYSKKSGGVRIDSIQGSGWEKRFLFGGSPL